MTSTPTIHKTIITIDLFAILNKQRARKIQSRWFINLWEASQIVYEYIYDQKQAITLCLTINFVFFLNTNTPRL